MSFNYTNVPLPFNIGELVQLNPECYFGRMHASAKTMRIYDNNRGAIFINNDQMFIVTSVESGAQPNEYVTTIVDVETLKSYTFEDSVHAWAQRFNRLRNEKVASIALSPER